MKHIRKIASLTLALILALACALPVMAAEPASITISKSPESGISLNGQTFYAYKIFDVTANDDGISYGYSIANEFEAFSNYPTFGTQSLREYIDTLDDDSAALNGLAVSLWDYIDTNSIAATGEETAASAGAVTISGLPYGYYLVYGSATSEGMPLVAACTLTTALKNENVTLKADAPTITHQVWRTDWDTWADTSIWSTVDYRITSKVPVMNGYTSYVYTVHGALGDGLDLDADSVVVKVDDIPLTAGVDYTLNLTPADGDSFDIVFSPAIFAAYTPGSAIEITYSADVNPAAAPGTAGNPSGVVLEYSNDPNTGGTGRTPNQEVKVYTYYFDIYKYTGTLGVDDRALSGAIFELRTDPTDTDTDPVIRTNGTPANGRRNLSGFLPGGYYLVDSKAPDGFNRMETPIEIKIGAMDAPDSFTVTADGTPAVWRTVNVLNNSGPMLPSTGGSSTVLFYLLGIVLVMPLLVALVLRKKRRTNQE